MWRGLASRLAVLAALARRAPSGSCTGAPVALQSSGSRSFPRSAGG